MDELRRYNGGKRYRPHGMLSLEGLDPAWESHLPGSSENPEETALRRLDSEKAWQTPLPAPCRRITERVFCRGDPRATVARDERVSEPRIHQRITQALDRMRKRLLDP